LNRPAGLRWRAGFRGVATEVRGSRGALARAVSGRVDPAARGHLVSHPCDRQVSGNRW